MAAILNRQIIASLSSCVAWLLLGSLTLAQPSAPQWLYAVECARATLEPMERR